MRFRRKPGEDIEAEQYTGDLPPPPGVIYNGAEPPHVVTAHMQKVYLEHGDWIVPEPGGRGHYPIKPDILQKLYEPAKGPSVAEQIATLTRQRDDWKRRAKSHGCQDGGDPDCG